MKLVILGVLLSSSVAVANPLKIEVKPATLTWKPKQPVKVVLEVTNTSAKQVRLKVMSCSWGEHWKSGDPELTWSPWSCDKNAIAWIDLDPEQSRDWTLEMYATEKAKPGAHALTMTFKQDSRLTKSPAVTITVAP